MPPLMPLVDDEYTGAPGHRLLDAIVSKRNAGMRGVGTYCAYAPVELIRAAGAFPVSLCAHSQKSISAAHEVLPANLCPLIKSSYGAIHSDSCPFFALVEAVIAEATCDGKKKMFEMLAERKPLHMMDLPQLADEPASLPHWQVMVHRLRDFLEATLEVEIRDADVERELCATNRRNRMMDHFFAYAEHHPVLVSWSELYDVIALAQSLTAEELEVVLQQVLTTLDRRRSAGFHHGTAESPRVLVSGCPLGGDSAKVLRLIEEAGGMIVALEACSGMKPFQLRIAEDTGAPLRAIAEAYLTIPCACMTPNARRFSSLDGYIRRFRPDAVIDVTLQACHAFNVESYRVEKHVGEKYGLPFLHLETDYSAHDLGQLHTRIEALLEMIPRGRRSA